MKPKGELTENAERIFEELLKELDGNSQSVDAYALSLLAGCLDELHAIDEEIKKEANPFVNKHGQIHPLQTQRNKTMDNIIKFFDRFGMSPRARDRSSAPAPAAPKKSPLEKYK
ncbi:MAG: P27 family phage terminase small subunit [Lewinella sp.]|uniref:P27 family phage terminase small subunit n=1 Tax=Lewinella sp. TaxID=2004506 RepID=UPI003D6B6D8D